MTVPDVSSIFQRATNVDAASARVELPCIATPSTTAAVQTRARCTQPPRRLLFSPPTRSCRPRRKSTGGGIGLTTPVGTMFGFAPVGHDWSTHPLGNRPLRGGACCPFPGRKFATGAPVERRSPTCWVRAKDCSRALPPRRDRSSPHPHSPAGILATRTKASADEDAAALVAADDCVRRLALDAVDLGGREREVTAAARAPDQPGRADATEPRPQLLVEGEQVGRDGCDRVRPRRLLGRELRVDGRLGLGD